MTELLTMVSIVGIGLLAGGLVAVAVAVVPLMTKLDLPDYLRLHDGLDAQFDPFMPILNVTTMLAAVGWLVVAPGGWPRAGVAFGLAMAVAVALVSQFGNRPINQRITGWHRDHSIPATAQGALRRWKALHQVRTAAAVLGFLAYGLVAVTGS